MTKESRLGTDALLRPSSGREPWAKVRSADTGKVVAGVLLKDHWDGNPNHPHTATISLGGIWPVTGEVLARGVLHQFGPLSAAEREERGLEPPPARQRKSLNGEPLDNAKAW